MLKLNNTNQRFSNLFGKHSAEKKNALIDSYNQEGKFLNPIIYRKSDYAILDGYLRYEIIQDLNISDFPSEPVDIENDDDAELWIRQWASNQKNLTKIMFKYNIGKAYLLSKKIQGGNHGNQYSKSGKTEIFSDCQTTSTAEEIGKKFGICERTVHHCKKLAERLDIIFDIVPDFKEVLFQDELKKTDCDIQILSNHKPFMIKRLVSKAIKDGGFKFPKSSGNKREDNSPVLNDYIQNDDHSEKLKDNNDQELKFAIKKVSIKDIDKLEDNSADFLVFSYDFNYESNYDKCILKINQKNSQFMVKCESYQIPEVIFCFEDDQNYSGIVIIKKPKGYYDCYVLFGQDLEISNDLYSDIESAISAICKPEWKSYILID